MSWLFSSGDQSIGTSPLASVLPMNIQGWFPLGLTSLISLLSKGFSRVFSSTAVRKHQFSSVQVSLWSKSHIHTWLLEKPQLWLYGPLLAKGRLCFSSKEQASFNFMVAVIICSDFGAQENKVCHCSHFSPICLPVSDGIGCHDLVFWTTILLIP